MRDPFSLPYRLADHPGALGLACDEQGLRLAGVPLLQKGPRGFEPLPAWTIRLFMRRAYGIEDDVAHRMAKLAAIAQALNAGEVPRAMILALHLRLPDVEPSAATHLATLAKNLRKAGFDPDQARDDQGRWTNEGGSDNGDAGGDTGNPAEIALPDPFEANRAVGIQVADNTQTPVTSDATEAASPPAPAETEPSPAPLEAHLPTDWHGIDELGSLTEWIANATPADEQAIRAAIKYYYYDHDDTTGGNALNAALSDALTPGMTVPQRQALLDQIEVYAKTDPSLMAGVHAIPLSLAGMLDIDAKALEQAATVLETKGPEALTVAERETLARNIDVLAGKVARGEINIWQFGWSVRGLTLEKLMGGNLQAGFKKIDFWDEATGLAASIKSIDLNMPSYQRISNLKRMLNRYINLLDKFDGDIYGGTEIDSSEILYKELRIAFPKNTMTADRQELINNIAERAKKIRNSHKNILLLIRGS